MSASVHCQLSGPFTIHIDDTGAMSDEAIRGRKDIVDADAKTNFLNYLDIGSQMEMVKFGRQTILCWHILHLNCLRCSRRLVFENLQGRSGPGPRWWSMSVGLVH